MTDYRLHIRSRVKPILMFAARWIVVFGSAAMACSQTDPQPQSEASLNAKRRPAFEVISIRQNTAASGPVQFGQTPDGFHSIGLPIVAMCQLTYAPSNESAVLRGDRIVG